MNTTHDSTTMERQSSSIELMKGGARVSISPEGAWVEKLSVANVDVLFPKQTVIINGSEKTRGGMHVCLPQFGPDDGQYSLPQHGFGREVEWVVTRRGDGSVSMHFDGNDEGRYGEKTSYPAGLVADLVYAIEEDHEGISLVTALTVFNAGSKDIPIAPGFHPYFQIDSDEEVAFPNGMKPGKPEDWVVPTFHTMSQEFEVSMGNKTILLASPDLQEYVVWSDSPDKYVCIEPTQFGDKIFNTSYGREMIKPDDQRQYVFSISILNK